jgi:hypothetical protein
LVLVFFLFAVDIWNLQKPLILESYLCIQIDMNCELVRFSLMLLKLF